MPAAECKRRMALTDGNPLTCALLDAAPLGVLVGPVEPSDENVAGDEGLPAPPLLAVADAGAVAVEVHEK